MPLLGIDLGTTFSAMAYLDANGTPTTIPNNEGELTTPSVVLFEKNGEIIVGRDARRAALAEPGSVADGVKRFMGDPVFPKLIHGRKFTPVEISGLILLKLVQDAQKKMGTIDGVVITVPAYFDEARRQATAAAGSLAGVKVIDIINEPTSAALAYAYRTFSRDGDKRGPAATTPDTLPSTVLVYDLGGGTFDVTILKIVGKDLTVLATAGDVRLGGRDWDERLFKHMADAFLHENGEDPRDNPVSTQNLMLTAEETKKVLSSRKQTTYVVNHAGKSFTGQITREQFDEMTQDLLYRSENRLSRVIKQANHSWDQIGQVLAVGGSTRMPQVLEMLRRVTGKDPNCSLSPDEAVAHGAAIHAAICATRPVQAPKPTPAAAPAPAPAQPTAKVAGAAPPPARPMPLAPTAEQFPEVVESLPSVLAFFKKHTIELLRSIRTTNVNSHSLGIVVTGPGDKKRVSVLIPVNTQLPFSVNRQFGTVRDNQQTVTVRVVEGESHDPADCILVGACSIEQLPKGLPKSSPVDVTFTYDNSGRLHVSAVEVSSGKWAAASITRHAKPGRTRQQLAADPRLSKPAEQKLPEAKTDHAAVK